MAGPLDMPFFDSTDLVQMRARGIDPKAVEKQLCFFRDPPAPLQLRGPCRVGSGIRRLISEETDCEDRWRSAARQGRFLKFVPASGAASRMFAFLQRVSSDAENRGTAGLRHRAGKGDAAAKQTLDLLADLERFPFSAQLGEAVSHREHGTWEELRDRDPATLITLLLSSSGLGLASLPKGMIPFHRYGSEVRTAFEEHLVEGSSYLANDGAPCRFHFTVAADHQEAFRQLADRLIPKLQTTLGCPIEIEFSLQDPATDTLSVDLDNRSVRDRGGELVFRPGGHGALLSNLGRLDTELVFIKNIDNVAPQRRHHEIGRWKRLLAGHLAGLQRKIFGLLEDLESQDEANLPLQLALDLLENDLVLRPPPRILDGSPAAQRQYLLRRLDRPLRICGVVPNRGEPGGAPFWVEEADGTMAGQIVEPGQVDRASDEQLEIWKSSTHFNPVDLVCALRDRRGRPYDLKRFVDDRTCFIAERQFRTKTIKTLELPGLWNGAMAGWNTVFVEVPEETFTPVKTVLDLLRPAHQP
jgi:hypothetical protein